MITLNREEYRKKLMGCWMGKNIGGTLGAPVEWFRQINDFAFYTQDLGGEPLPNDDLDIQLVWLIALEEKGVDLDALTLAEYWMIYVTPYWSEYGNARVNMNVGLQPPLSGTVNNPHKDSCGAFIRSEIWACIAPGRPDIAARYAYEDAIIDHGDGEGTYGEVFCAALESAAFVVPDIRKLIEIGLSYIPDQCGVADSVRLAVECFDTGKTWQEARDELLRLSRAPARQDLRITSPEDHEKGFQDGKLGYDAPSNIGILILGLLYGGDDFAKMICTTVNCGEDTDCTAATAGSVYGIIHGIEGIPEKWIEPIGHKIKTGCVNLGPLGANGIIGGHLPQSIDELTERTEKVAMRLIASGHADNVTILEDSPTDISNLDVNSLTTPDHGASLYSSLGGPRFKFPFFTALVDYGNDPFIRSGETKKLSVRIHNTYRIQANMAVKWYAPEGWIISPGREGMFMCQASYRCDPVTLEFSVTPDSVEKITNRCAVEFTVESRSLVMLVPIVFLNGSLQQKG